MYMHDLGYRAGPRHFSKECSTSSTFGFDVNGSGSTTNTVIRGTNQEAGAFFGVLRRQGTNRARTVSPRRHFSHEYTLVFHLACGEYDSVFSPVTLCYVAAMAIGRTCVCAVHESNWLVVFAQD